MIRCDVTSDEMRRVHGTVVHLELPLAMRLQAAGHVKIIETLGEARQAKVSGYLFRDGFKNTGDLRVAWIQDYDKDGGAELSNFVVVDAGERLGLDIVSVTPAGFNLKTLENADVIVVNNFFNFGEDNYQKILKALYELKKPFVKYEHDHREVTERRQQAERLFNASSLNIFISPLQLKNHVTAFPGIGGTILPLAIDVDRFKPVEGTVRAAGSVLVPSFEKCRANATKYIIEHPEREYAIVGFVDMPGQKNVKSIRKVKAEDMPKLYSEHQYMLHVPDKVGGGERVLFEAVLCGCKVICNENAAHSSWAELWDWRDPAVLRERLAKAPYEFWREVCRLKP
jgi:hypothetical protein